MTAPRVVGVIDIGKTNAKFALVDLPSRAEIAVRKTPNEVRRDGPYPHYDVERALGASSPAPSPSSMPKPQSTRSR